MKSLILLCSITILSVSTPLSAKDSGSTKAERRVELMLIDAAGGPSQRVSKNLKKAANASTSKRVKVRGPGYSMPTRR